MKKRFQIIKVFILLFALLSISGCEKDLYEEQIKQSTNDRIPSSTQKTVSFETFKNNIPYQNISGSLKNKFKSRYNIINSFSKEADAYTIDTTKVIYTTNGIYESYVMKVIKPNVENDKFTNIVFIPFNGIVESFIMEYKKSNDGKIESISQFSTEFVKKGEAFINPQIYESINTQKGWWELVHSPCTCAKHHSIFASEECPCETEGGGSGPSLFLVWHGDGSNVVVFPLPVSATPNNSTPQPAPEPTNPVPTNPTPTNPDGSGGAANENTNYEEQLFPISIRDFDLENECVSNFVSSISSDQEEWLNIGDNVLFNNIIYDLPNEQADCEANKEKAQAILNLLMANSNATLKYELKDYYNQTGDMQTVREILDQCILNPYVFTSIKPFLIEKNIDDSALDDCTKGIISSIKNLQQNDFATILKKLGPVNSIYNVEITHTNDLGTDSQGNEIIALTTWSGAAGTPIIPFNYTITIKDSLLLDATKIGIASTTLHELLHAYFLSLIDDYEQNVNTTLNTFPYLWDNYVTDLVGAGASLAQHTQIANKYVTNMASALKEYAISTGTPSTYPNLDQICSDLAWGGLEDTSPYIALSQEVKKRIQARLHAENSNSSRTANGISYNPVGQPCD